MEAAGLQDEVQELTQSLRPNSSFWTESGSPSHGGELYTPGPSGYSSYGNPLAEASTEEGYNFHPRRNWEAVKWEALLNENRLRSEQSIQEPIRVKARERRVGCRASERIWELIACPNSL